MPLPEEAGAEPAERSSRVGPSPPVKRQFRTEERVPAPRAPSLDNEARLQRIVDE